MARFIRNILALKSWYRPKTKTTGKNKQFWGPTF